MADTTNNHIVLCTKQITHELHIILKKVVWIHTNTARALIYIEMYLGDYTWILEVILVNQTIAFAVPASVL